MGRWLEESKQDDELRMRLVKTSADESSRRDGDA